jgi:hypothetical protein
MFYQDGAADCILALGFGGSSKYLRSCATPFLPDFQSDSANASSWTISTSGGLTTLTAWDTPQVLATSFMDFLLGITDSASFRDFLEVQIGNDPPQVVSELQWQFLMGAQFTAGTPAVEQSAYVYIIKPKTIPSYGTIPTGPTIIQPRSPTLNDYNRNPGNWTQVPF